MKCNITLPYPQERGWFTSGDQVKGTIEIGVRNEVSISTFSVSFYGRMKLSFMPDQEENSISSFPAPQALDLTKIIHKTTKFLPEDPSWELMKGHHSIPFSICIPPLMYFQPEPPPTLDVQAPGLRVNVAYFVRVDISCRGVLRPKIASRKEVVFRSPNNTAPPLSRAAVTAMLPVDSIDPRKSVPYEAPYLPQYSPSLEVRLTIPSPPVLCTGEPLDVKLAVAATEDLIKRLGVIRLRSLCIRLRCLTAVRIGSVGREAASYVNICSMTGDVIIKPSNETGATELDHGIWQRHLIPPALPTFSSENISLSYALEVIAGFSGKGLSNIQYAVIAVDVLVASSTDRANQPPAYSQ